AAIGFSIRKDLSQLKSREAFLSELAREHPNMKKGRLVNGASQLYRFVHEIREGDLILTPVTDTREILVGTCAGPYRYDSRRDGDLPHTRPINWTKRISRDELTGPAKNSAGSTLTLFSMNDHRDEIEAVASGREPPEPLGADSDEGSEFQFYEDVQSKAEEQISDRIAHMDPFDFEELVFIELLMEHYERMEPEARAMIPLKRVFIPID
ncbi:MAG: hypothetical protein OXK77_12355, partial [Gemmatimonadota bacterium]|nr:hypothetical protein [Gemmatimonadota bacterium]